MAGKGNSGTKVSNFPIDADLELEKIDQETMNEVIFGSQINEWQKAPIRKKRKKVPMEVGLPSPERTSEFTAHIQTPSEPSQKKKREFLRDFTERKNRYSEKSIEPFTVLISQNLDTRTIEETSPEHLEVRGIGAVHPMLIGKKLKNLSGAIKEIKRKGRNLVEVNLHTYQEANKLIDTQDSLLPDAWKAYIPDSKISRLGVGRDIDPSLSEKEILEGIEWASSPTRIMKIERIMKVSRISNNINLTPTNSVKFTFEGNDLPEKLIIYKTRIPIIPYEPRVRRCTKCQRFGHLMKQCRGNSRCSFCGENHTQSECKSIKPNCTNCKGPHPANDPNCPTYIKIKNINKIKSLLNIEREEASEIVKANRLDSHYRLETWLQRRTEITTPPRERAWILPPQIQSESFQDFPPLEESVGSVRLKQKKDKLKHKKSLLTKRKIPKKDNLTIMPNLNCTQRYNEINFTGTDEKDTTVHETERNASTNDKTHEGTPILVTDAPEEPPPNILMSTPKHYGKNEESIPGEIWKTLTNLQPPQNLSSNRQTENYINPNSITQRKKCKSSETINQIISN